jgi:hypothetical protein
MIFTMPKCPMSEMATESLQKISDSYQTLVQTAAELERSEQAPEYQKHMAFLRAERVGRVLDNLLACWEENACPPVFFSCSWQQCERNLQIINALTPCDQWSTPNFTPPTSSTSSTDSTDSTTSTTDQTTASSSATLNETD